MYTFPEYLAKKLEYKNILVPSESTPQLEQDETQTFNGSFMELNPKIIISEEIPYKQGDEIKNMRLASVMMKVESATGEFYYPLVTVNTAMEMKIAKPVKVTDVFGVQAVGKISKSVNANPYNRYDFRLDPLNALKPVKKVK